MESGWMAGYVPFTALDKTELFSLQIIQYTET